MKKNQRVYVGPLSDSTLQKVITLLKHEGISYETQDFDLVREEIDSLRWIAKYKEESLSGYLMCLYFHEDDVDQAKRVLYPFFGFEKPSEEIPDELKEDPNEEVAEANGLKKKPRTVMQMITIVAMFLVALSFIIAYFK